MIHNKREYPPAYIDWNSSGPVLGNSSDLAFIVPLYRFLQANAGAMQTIPLDTYSGQANESNVMYQMRASDVIVHPNTLPIGAQSNSSLVSTPITDYANQPPQFAPAVITNEMHSDAAQVQQSMSSLTYSEVIKLAPMPQAQGKCHTRRVISRLVDFCC